MKLGNAIRLRREELNISLEQLAEITGRSIPTMYRYESSSSIPLDIFLEICDALKISPNDLLSYTEYKEKIDNNEIIKHQLININICEDIYYENDELKLAFGNSSITIYKNNISEGNENNLVGFRLSKSDVKNKQSVFIATSKFTKVYNEYYITFNEKEGTVDCCKLLKVQDNDDIFKNLNNEFFQDLKIVAKVILSVSFY